MEIEGTRTIDSVSVKPLLDTADGEATKAEDANNASASVFTDSQTATKNQSDYNALKTKFEKKYGKGYFDKVNKNIAKIANDPLVLKTIEKYKGTPLYDNIKLAFQGNQHALVQVLSNKKVQKDVNKLLGNKNIQEKILDMAPNDEIRDSLKELFSDKDLKGKISDIIDGKNVDKNVQDIMDDSKVQDFVRSLLKDPDIRDLIKQRTKDFPMKNKLFDSLDNPIVRYGTIKTIMSDENVQKIVAQMIKTGNFNIDKATEKTFKDSLKKSDTFLSDSANIMRLGLFGGTTAGAAAGDVVGSYIPLIGRPVFSTIGAVTGGLLGGVGGVLGSLGYGIARPFMRD